MRKGLLIFCLNLVMISLMSAQTYEQYLVNSKTLNMRSGAGKENTIIAVLSMGDELKVLEKNENGWWSVEHNGLQGYVFSQLLVKDPNSGWEKKHYNSGDVPECENFEEQFDYKLDNYLKVNVGANSDVVVKLMRKQTYGDICIRMVYVRSNNICLIKNIPEGNYYLKIAYGKDWRQTIADQKCIGKFMKNAMYEIGKENLNYNLTRQYDGYSVPSFELFLDVIVTENKSPTFKTNQISEAEFNK
jgi:hypothetical protein